MAQSRARSDSEALSARSEQRAENSAKAVQRAQMPRAAAPSFAALAQWNRLSAPGVQIPRDQEEGLPALVDSAVRAAGTPGPMLAAPVDLRIVLERDGTPLAVLELAGNEVRYTPAGGAPFTGMPPQPTLRALRDLLAPRR